MSSLGIEFDDLAIERLFKRMPDQHLVPVVLDAHGVWPVFASKVRPGQKAGDDILWPLQPFKADYCDGCWFGATFLYASPCELIDLVAGNSVLLGFRAALQSEVVPWIRVLLVEKLRMQPMHDTPDLAAEAHHFLPLAQPDPVRAIDDLFVNFIRSTRRDFANPPPALTDSVADQLHDAFVVGT